MRFMMMVKADRNYEAGVPPPAELMVAVGRLTEEMTRRGIVLDAGGLAPSAAGARVRVAGGTVTVTDGPFAETKEIVGGYAILRAESRAHAIELARQFMQLHADVLGPSYEGELEVRQLAEFGPQKPGCVTS